MVQRLHNITRVILWATKPKNCTYDERSHSVLHEFLQDVAVVSNSCSVYGIIPSTIGNNPRPRDREPVRLHSILLQQRDIFFPKTVRVSCNITIGATLDFPWDFAKCVPDRRSASVFIERPFNLVGCCAYSLESICMLDQYRHAVLTCGESPLEILVKLGVHRHSRSLCFLTGQMANKEKAGLWDSAL